MIIHFDLIIIFIALTIRFYMENTEKFTNNKQIIAFLTAQFPLCFIATGIDAKPLKIGVFQELAKRLENEERVSKTQVRGALRQYTLSWRYLHCVKETAKRVDLDAGTKRVFFKRDPKNPEKAIRNNKIVNSFLNIIFP